MPIKSGIIILAIIVLIGFWFTTDLVPDEVKTDKEPAESQLNQTILPNHQTIIKKPTKPKIQSTGTNERISLRNQVLAELSQHMVHDDPYLELIAIRDLVSLCREPKLLENLFNIQNELQAIHRQLLKALNQDCEQHRLTYPTIYEQEEPQDLVTLFVPTSPLGILYEQFMKSLFEKEDKSLLYQQVLSAAIQSKNSEILSQLSYMFHFEQDLDPKIVAVIGSKDQIYNAEVSKLAIQSLACEFNPEQDCTPTSTTMLLNCAFNLEVCGLNHSQWLQQSTLAGMRNDIEKVKAYYRQMGR